MRGRPLQDMAVGDSAELTRTATAGDVAEFIDSIGDHNPIHQDHEYAASTRFEKPIVPGMWTAIDLSAAAVPPVHPYTNARPGGLEPRGGRKHREGGLRRLHRRIRRTSNCVNDGTSRRPIRTTPGRSGTS